MMVDNLFTYKLPESLSQGVQLTSETREKIASALLTLDKIANGLEFVVPSLTFKEAKKRLVEYLQQRSTEAYTGDESCNIVLNKDVMLVLSYNVCEFDDNESHLQDEFLNILRSDRNTRYFSPLCHAILSNWEKTIVAELRTILHSLPLNDKRMEILSYLGEDGIQILVDKLNASGISIDDAPSFFCLSNIYHDIYFRYAIKLYYERKDINRQMIRELSASLKLHNDPITSKIVIPELIIRAHNTRTQNQCLRYSYLFKEDLISLAESHIGQIGQNEAWFSISGNQDELTKAHQILIQLLVDKILDKIFRESRANNHFEERSEFWSNYSHKIAESITSFPTLTSLKIYSQNSNITRQTLLSGRNLSCISITNPQGNLDGNVAVIMRMHNYTIIEFLDVGCAYFYRAGDRRPLNGHIRNMYAEVWTMPIDSVEDLKCNNLPQRTQTNREEQVWNISLKMAHQGNAQSWNDLFSTWILTNIVHYNTVSAIVVDNGKVFCVRNPAGGNPDMASKWEFPNGEIQRDETDETALKRILKKDMGFEIIIERHLKTISHVCPGFSITKCFYICHPRYPIQNDTIHLRKHTAHRWSTSEHLREIELVKPDSIITRELVGEF